jgi:hypothetical protein
LGYFRNFCIVPIQKLYLEWEINPEEQPTGFAGGKRLALFYSLLASCKKQQVNPWEYLKDVLERMPMAKISQLRNMLPDKWKAVVQTNT